METNENENKIVQNLWDMAKAVVRGKYIAIQASLKRIEKSKIQTLGRLGGAVIKRLPLAQDVIPALWDRGPHQAPPL